MKAVESRKSMQILARSAFPVFAGAVVVAMAAPSVHASVAEELLQILKAKGTLTQQEYEMLSKKVEDERRNEQAEKAEARQKATATETKREEEAKKEIKASYRDGLTWESADGATSFGVNGRVQLDYRSFGGDNNAFTDTFDVRRARLGVRGKFLKDYSYVVEGDFGSSPILTDAYLDIGWWKSATIRLGQFKSPISLEELTSSRFIDFQERSFVNNASLTPARERGAMVFGEPLDGFTYAVALTSGEGQNSNETSFTADTPDIIGRVTVNVARFLEQKDAVYHLGVSGSQGKQTPVLDPASQRTEGRGITFFNPTAFTGTADIDRMRYGLEAAAALGPVKFQAEYSNVNFEGTSALGVNYDRDINAYYASVLWMITGESYASVYRGGTFSSRIRPKASYTPGSGGLGAWELGVRYSKFDASDFRSTNPVGTGVLPLGFANEADAITIGLKWIVNPNVRFLLNYVQTDFDTPVTSNGINVSNEKAITLRSQIDF